MVGCLWSETLPPGSGPVGGGSQYPIPRRVVQSFTPATKPAGSRGAGVSLHLPSMAVGSIWPNANSRSWRPSSPDRRIPEHRHLARGDRRLAAPAQPSIGPDAHWQFGTNVAGQARAPFPPRGVTRRYAGSRGVLTCQNHCVSLLAFTQPPATLAEASTRIAELTGIERSPAQVGKVLQQFGLKRRKTGAIPGPAPTPERQAERATFQEQELEPRLAQAQAGQRAVSFVDAAHFVHGLFLSWLWCVARCWQPTPAGRHRLNVLGRAQRHAHN